MRCWNWPPPAPKPSWRDTGVCVHPEDERYAGLVGKKIIVPVIGRAVPLFVKSELMLSYSSFVLKDTLDSCLKFRSGSVTTSAGKDVTSRFRIENTKNTITFTANTSYLKSEEAFNDVTYYFRIKVTAGSKYRIVT